MNEKNLIIICIIICALVALVFYNMSSPTSRAANPSSTPKSLADDINNGDKSSTEASSQKLLSTVPSISSKTTDSEKNLIISSSTNYALVRDTSASSSNNNNNNNVDKREKGLRKLYPINAQTQKFDFPSHITEIALEGGTNIRAELTDWLCGSYDTNWELDGSRNVGHELFTNSSERRKNKRKRNNRKKETKTEDLFGANNRALISAEPIPQPFEEMKYSIGKTCTKAFFPSDPSIEKSVNYDKKSSKRKRSAATVHFEVKKTRASEIVQQMMMMTDGNNNKNKNKDEEQQLQLPALLPLNAAFAPKHAIFPLHISKITACSSLNQLNNDYSKNVMPISKDKDTKMMQKVDHFCSQNADDKNNENSHHQVPTIPLADLISLVPDRVRVVVVAIDAQGFDWSVMQSLLPSNQYLRVANLVSECQDLPRGHKSFITHGAISCSEMIACVDKFFVGGDHAFEFVKCRENNGRSREYNCLWTNKKLVSLALTGGDNDENREKEFDYSDSEYEAIEAALGKGPDTKKLEFSQSKCSTEKLLV